VGRKKKALGLDPVLSKKLGETDSLSGGLQKRVSGVFMGGEIDSQRFATGRVISGERRGLRKKKKKKKKGY